MYCYRLVWITRLINMYAVIFGTKFPSLKKIKEDLKMRNMFYCYHTQKKGLNFPETLQMKWSEQGNIIIGHLRNGKGHFFFCFEEEKNILSHVNVGHSSTLYNDNRQQKGLFPLHKLLVSGRKSCFSKKRNKASHCKVKCVSEVVLHRHRGKKTGG